jgi:thioredoxin reductase (NADPH)
MTSQATPMPTFRAARAASGDPLALAADDPYARVTQIYPVLSADQIGRLSPYGVEEAIGPNQSLFHRGDRQADFFLVLEGEVAITRTGDDGDDDILTVHDAGRFTGELDQINAQTLLVGARALIAGRVLRIKHGDVPRMMAAEPDIGEIIMRAFILRRMGFLQHGQAGLVVLGVAGDADTLRLEEFATRNGYPTRLVDAEVDPEISVFLAEFDLSVEALPVVITPDRAVLLNPSLMELANHLGLSETFDPNEVWDVVVVGAGPAGLSAATYAASEGLKTLIIEAKAPGGQAGTSSKIENYLGFPTGISGLALAGRAQIQAQKFGARLSVSRRVVDLDCAGRPYRLRLEDDQAVSAHTVVIASGAQYRKLDVPNDKRFEGRAIHYAATAMEAKLCRGQEVVVVGGGNSAGQAAMFLSRQVEHVHLLVRGDGLAATMSDYLVQRIARSPRITLHVCSEITGLEGDQALDTVVWEDHRDGGETRLACSHVFVMIGATPNTDWLRGCLALDAAGFVETGRASDPTGHVSPYETEKLGVYAVGDVRSGSVKRVASSVGEGSVVIQALHARLESLLP